jgi:rubredoxin
MSKKLFYSCCPECKSNNTGLFAYYVRATHWKCNDCGHYFILPDKPDEDTEGNKFE